MKKFFIALLFSVLFWSGCSSPLTSAPELNENAPQKDAQALQAILDGPAKKCAELQGSGSQFSCYKDLLQKIVQEESPKLAFAFLKQAYENTPSIKEFCHPYTHEIGRAAMKKYGTLAEAYQNGDGFCWSGFYHGVMEEISNKIGRNNIVTEMPRICADIPGKERYSFDYYNCVHGMGHGVMAVTENELFESLKLCDGLVGRWEQESCYGGVFMENVIVDNLSHFTKYLNPKKPLYPCDAVDTPYKQQCYLMQTSYMLKVSKYDFAKVFALCEQADKDFVETCYQSLGRDASGSTVSNAEKARKLCLLGKDFTAQSNCMIGAVKDFVSYFHSDVQAKEFCQSFEDQKLAELCLRTQEEYYKTF